MKKLELNKQKKESALYNTAFELFTTKGITKTTISDIVERAGVAKGTFYLYFKDKYDIRNKLVAYKAREMFHRVDQCLIEEKIQGIERQVHYMVDLILNEMETKPTLMTFLAKNLSWGILQGIFEEKNGDREGRTEYQSETLYTLSHYSQDQVNQSQLLLFTIVELISSSCYSCILYKQPVSLEEYRPFLHKTIEGILSTCLPGKEEESETKTEG